MIISIAAIGLGACGEVSSLEPVSRNSGKYSSIVMIVSPSEVDEDVAITKNTIVRGDANTETKYVWSETDTVGIFPDAGSQIYFSMKDGVGQTTASFDGGGWALREESSYYSYFPFLADYSVNRDAIPYDYRGQEQVGNSSASLGTKKDLGKYCFMAANGEAGEEGTLFFDYKKIGAVFILTVPVESGEYTSATLLADAAVIPYKGTFNAVKADQKLYNVSLSDTLSIGFRNMIFQDKGMMTFYLAFPPFEYVDRQVTIVSNKSDGTSLVSSFIGKAFAVDKVYPRSPNLSISPASVGISNLGGTINVRITTAAETSYSVSTDVDWITLDSDPTFGDATIVATVAQNDGYRSGHIIVSEVVSGSAGSVTLQNKVMVSQNPTGYSVGIGDWGYSEKEEGEAF